MNKINETKIEQKFDPGHKDKFPEIRYISYDAFCRLFNFIFFWIFSDFYGTLNMHFRFPLFKIFEPLPCIIYSDMWEIKVLRIKNKQPEAH